MLPLLLIATLCLLAAGEDTDGQTCKKIGKIVTSCTCEDAFFVGDSYSVHCNFVRSLDHLKEILILAKEGKNMHLEFYELQATEIPYNMFEGVNIEFLQFENSKIKTFGDQKPFSGLENSLKTLRLYDATAKIHSDVAAGRNATLSHLNVLEHLTLYNEDLREIPEFWFQEGPTTLQTLSFEKNKIATIGDNAFAPLEKLSHIYFFSNRISTLKRSMFPTPAKELLVLDFSLNRITDLPTDFFSDMPKLSVVHIDSNYLMTLNQATWQGILQNNMRIEILLEGNILHCDDKIKWIYEASVENTLYGRCAVPHHLKGKALRNLEIKDFESSGETDD